MNLVAFSRYIVAASKRMTAHFGVPSAQACRAIESNRGEVRHWFEQGVPSDKVARLLADRITTHANPLGCSCPMSNPLNSNGFLTLGALLSTAIGVWFIAKGVNQREQVAATSVPNFTPAQPIVRQL